MVRGKVINSQAPNTLIMYIVSDPAYNHRYLNSIMVKYPVLCLLNTYKAPRSTIFCFPHKVRDQFFSMNSVRSLTSKDLKPDRQCL